MNRNTNPCGGPSNYIDEKKMMKVRTILFTYTYNLPRVNLTVEHSKP